MPKMTDQHYLVTSQYKSAENLNKRSLLHERFSTNQVSWYSWVFDHLRLPQYATVLEVGCGTGMLWVHNRERIPTGWNFVFGDLSHGMLQEAKKNLAFLGQRALFQVLDAQLLFFDPESFDAIIANHVLYHVPNVPRALQELALVLKSEGVLLAATNGAEHLLELRSLIAAMPGIYEMIPPDSLLFNLKYSFNLENGENLLSKHFSKVTLHRFEDALRVTEADPLFDYIVSLIPDARPDTQPEIFNRLHGHVEEAIAASGGVFDISKSIGLFECRK